MWETMMLVCMAYAFDCEDHAGFFGVTQRGDSISLLHGTLLSQAHATEFRTCNSCWAMQCPCPHAMMRASQRQARYLSSKSCAVRETDSS